MDKKSEKEIQQLVRKTMREEIPEMFGRSLVQLKKFFISNIN